MLLQAGSEYISVHGGVDRLSTAKLRTKFHANRKINRGISQIWPEKLRFALRYPTESPAVAVTRANILAQPNGELSHGYQGMHFPDTRILSIDPRPRFYRFFHTPGN